MTDYQIVDPAPERVFLVGAEARGSRPLIGMTDSLTELALLADTAGMEVVGQANSFTMGACLTCHRNPHERLPNAKEINAQPGPDNCSTCHR